MWHSVAAGKFFCSLDQNSAYFCYFSFPALVQSVQSMSQSVTPAQTAAWRRQIFEQLSERTKREIDNFRHYEQAIEQVHAILESSDQPLSLMVRIFVILSLFSSASCLFIMNCCAPLAQHVYTNAVCVGEEGNHAVVERLEATQVDRCSFCPGAVLRTRGQQGRHPFHLLQLL